MYSGLKLYPARPLQQLALETSGFELDHEITVKLYRGGLRFGEAPIRYRPRSVAVGKKIRPRDGIIALWAVLRYRVKPYARCVRASAGDAGRRGWGRAPATAAGHWRCRIHRQPSHRGPPGAGQARAGAGRPEPGSARVMGVEKQ